MFKVTVNVGEFRSKLKTYMDMVNKAGDVVRIRQRLAGPLRVLITQNEYLELLGKVTRYELELGIQNIEETRVAHSGKLIRSTSSDNLES